MFEQLVVGGKVELFKKSRRIKENGETKEMLVSQIMDINDETIICTMPSRRIAEWHTGILLISLNRITLIRFIIQVIWV